MIRLTTNFCLFSFLIALPPIMAVYLGHGALLTPKFGLIFAFYFLLTYVVCAVVIMGQRMSDKSGVQLFLIATTIKLLACMIFALIYIRIIPANKHVFVLGFFYIYFLNTGFEIYSLLTNLRVQNKK